MTNQTDFDKRLEEILEAYFLRRVKAINHHIYKHRRNPEHTGVDDAIRDIKRNANTELKSLIIELLEGVIGEDEVIHKEADMLNGSMAYARNQLRAEQRQAINQLKGKELR